MRPAADKPRLTPKLRFPEFRDAEGWPTMPGNVGFDQISNREAPARLPILAITQEYGAIPRDDIDYHVSVTDKSIETYKEVMPGDFIISLRSFQGGIEYSEYHGICSPAYVILRKRIELEVLFYKHLFKSRSFILLLTKNLEGLRDGKMISYAQFSALQLPSPSLPEQRKIAACLSSLDDLIGAERRKLGALKAHKKGLLQNLFPRQGEIRPRLRFLEFRDVGEWTFATLGQLATYENGKAYEQDITEHGKYIVVNSRFISTNGSIRKFSNAKHLIASADDVLMVLSDLPKGKALAKCFFVAVNDLYAVNQRVCRLKPNRVLGKFLYHTLNRHPHLLAFDDGMNQTHLSKGSVIECPLCVPPNVEEQHRIASCLSSLDDLIAAQTDRIEALKTHKKGLMQQLFPSPENVES